jgi:phosphoglucomutase
VPEIFRRVGLKHLYTVPEQMVIDGNFPTVEKPNPEYANVFTLGIEIANKVGSDLVIATDPDSDRVGVMTRTKDGSFATISGNQMGALLLDYVINQKKKLGTITKNAYCVKSIVSTEMANKIAEMNGIVIHEVLTGFKYIGEVIKNYENRGEEDGFLLGFEESYGYLLGSYARDKDAVGASMSILEMTAYYKKLGLTLSDALNALYDKYGFFSEKTIDIYMEGLDGIERRRRVMLSLRENAPVQFGGNKVSRALDYKSGTVTDVINSKVTKLDEPSSDVLIYVLENGDKIIVRPSGTEPKIKIYILASDADKATLDNKVALYAKEAGKLADI